MLFTSQDAHYLVGSGPSTTVPPNCTILDQQLHFAVLLLKIDDELKPIIANASSCLQAWLLLTEHFQGPISPASPVHDLHPMDITISVPPSPVCDGIIDISVAPPVIEDTIMVPRSLLSVDQSSITVDVSVPDADQSIMDIKSPSSGHTSSLLVSLDADAGKTSSYDPLLFAISTMALPIKPILSHSGLALVTWPLTPPHLFHEWPPPF